MNFVRSMQVSAVAAIGVVSSVIASAEEAAAPVAETPVAEAPATEAPVVEAPVYTDVQVFEAFGYLVGQRIGIAEFDLTPEEKAAALKGLDAAFSKELNKFDPDAFGPEIQRVLGGRQEAVMATQSAKANAEAASYFEVLKKNPAILSTPSGLHYEIIEAGTDPKPTPESTVKVHYTGKLIDGTVFDSSVERGEPVEFPLGGVISGWTEGLQLVGAGGKLKLYIPGDLAYGATPPPGSPITPNATLVFDVELLEVK